MKSVIPYALLGALVVAPAFAAGLDEAEALDTERNIGRQGDTLTTDRGASIDSPMFGADQLSAVPDDRPSGLTDTDRDRFGASQGGAADDAQRGTATGSGGQLDMPGSAAASGNQSVVGSAGDQQLGTAGQQLGLADDPDTITQVQRRLQALGYDPGPIDGIYGERTRRAVMQWEQASGLEADGQIDGQVLAGLGVDAAGSSVARVPGQDDNQQAIMPDAGDRDIIGGRRATPRSGPTATPDIVQQPSTQGIGERGNVSPAE